MRKQLHSVELAPVNNKLPLHTRLGVYASTIILILLCLFMLRNCVSAFYYSGKTSKQEVDRSYHIGFIAGMKKSQNISQQVDNKSANPLLHKMYLKGFRDGSDFKDMDEKKNSSDKGKK